MKIQVLVDNPNSWQVPLANNLVNAVRAEGHEADFITSQESVKQGDILFLLGCEKMAKPPLRALHTHNIVIHISDLPQGKGMSPLSWQIQEGRNEIKFTLFEAVDLVDAGPIYLKGSVTFEGHELVAEMREKLAEGMLALALEYVRNCDTIEGRAQVGESSYYPRRTSEHSRLDPAKTLAEQFDLLRIVDNQRYPAFFEYRGHRYILKIEKAR